jgi:hypothetical protein
VQFGLLRHDGNKCYRPHHRHQARSSHRKNTELAVQGYSITQHQQYLRGKQQHPHCKDRRVQMN